ncbi:MAG: exodeoxyribonuclease VII large subunit [Prevotella sp.]|nr:exodeoxyribonuclease VII large subunit [Prevotella sp.]
MILTDDTQPMTLSMLNGLVRETISLALPEAYWVQAELAGIRESRGHCYMELIEKVDDGSILAQARACCWKNTWSGVSRRFMETTQSPLSAGMKVLLCVRANFHEAFGFSWVVDDIDPNYTMGDMARRRQEIIRILTEEGVIDLNKQLAISPFCKRIAVISSPTAAGYGDFCNQLADNAYGFQFETQLFAAIMQGEQVESSIINALNQIHRHQQATAGQRPFDCVVIIRGGGSTADLSGFDTLALAENVANFSLPVITGIGHDRDKSILDIVACVSVKTPTAVAEFLVSNLENTMMRIDNLTDRIGKAIRQRIEHERLLLQNVQQRGNASVSIRIVREENKLKDYLTKTHNIAERQIIIENNKIKLIEQKISALDPQNILKKGYTLTLHDGAAVTSPTELHESDEVTIMFAQGTVKAVVHS